MARTARLSYPDRSAGTITATIRSTSPSGTPTPGRAPSSTPGSSDAPGSARASQVRELKAEEGGSGIYLCGGSRLAGELSGEIDELVIKTYPVALGSGMPMFGSGFPVAEFALNGVRTFANGVLDRTYSRKR